MGPAERYFRVSHLPGHLCPGYHPSIWYGNAIVLVDPLRIVSRDIQEQFGLALLFITHDFGIVAKMCDDVAVMYAGRLVERASVRAVFDSPAHPYTLALLQAVPKMDSKVERLFAIEGVPATGHTEFKGCSFASRCPVALEKCHVEPPPLVSVAANHFAECWRAEEVFARGSDMEFTTKPGTPNPDAGQSGHE